MSTTHCKIDNGRIKKLKQQVTRRGLKLEDVWESMHDPSIDEATLAALVKWIEAYEKCPNREKLEARGLLFPPVSPDIDPDSDWLRFEMWMQKKALERTGLDIVGPMKSPEQLNDEEVEKELERVQDILENENILVDFQERLPARLAYQELYRIVTTESFEVTGPDTRTHLTCCTGYCPDCIQKPYCDIIEDMDEDELEDDE